MKERTNNILNWALALITGGAFSLLIFFPGGFGSLALSIQKIGYMLADPSLILLEFATQSAISQFGGDTGMAGFGTALLLALLGVALLFVIAPTLMMSGYKAIHSSVSKKSLRPATWHLGTGIMLLAIGYGLYSTIGFSMNSENIIASSERQHDMDELQFELIDLYYAASAKAILPHEKGGGDGHFTNFLADDGSRRDIELNDLERYNPDSEYEFVIPDQIKDSTITIFGVSTFEGNNPDFQNADGTRGHVQLSITMNPYEDSRINIKRENEWNYATGN